MCCEIHSISFLHEFLSLPPLFSTKALFSLYSSSFFSDWRVGGAAAVGPPRVSETAPTQRLAVVDGGAAAPNAFFILFFRLFSSIPSSGPISHLKVLIQQIPSPRSTKEERKFYTFILGLDLFLCFPFKLIRSNIPLVRFRTSGMRG